MLIARLWQISGLDKFSLIPDQGLGLVHWMWPVFKIALSRNSANPRRTWSGNRSWKNMQRTFILFQDSCQNNSEHAITAFSVSQMVVHCVCTCDEMGGECSIQRISFKTHTKSWSDNAETKRRTQQNNTKNISKKEGVDWICLTLWQALANTFVFHQRCGITWVPWLLSACH